MVVGFDYRPSHYPIKKQLYKPRQKEVGRQEKKCPTCSCKYIYIKKILFIYIEVWDAGRTNPIAARVSACPLVGTSAESMLTVESVKGLTNLSQRCCGEVKGTWCPRLRVRGGRVVPIASSLFWAWLSRLLGGFALGVARGC